MWDFSNELNRIVTLYNRYSKDYKIKVLTEYNENQLSMNLLQGKGTDLLNLEDVYLNILAKQDVLEDLTPYYEASPLADIDDILESVRRACTVEGKEVAVIPAFTLVTLQEKEAYCPPDEWDIWTFLELAQRERLLEQQSPDKILSYCMGIRYGERFVDWEKKECYFDSEEFRRILEECAGCRTFKRETQYTPFEDGDWLLQEVSIDSIWGTVSDDDPDYSSKLLGYPGREGAECRIASEGGLFAINSASENKEGAWSFLEYMLSDEFQKLVYWGFPTRKSNFEASLQNRYTILTILPEAVPGEAESALLRKMEENALYDSWGGTNPIWHIAVNEAGMYFSGDATLDETVSKIQNRMHLYLNEN